MNKVISKMADYYGLGQLHKEYSQKSQFYIGDNNYSDIFSFHDENLLTDINFETKEKNIFKFSSNLSTGKCNDIVTGEYYKNNSETAVILVHGWRMKNIIKVKNIFHKLFLTENYDMYYLTLPYHLERDHKNSLYSGEYFISANVNRTIKSVQQSVHDIRLLILHLKKSYRKVVLIGTSLGGYICNITATVEKNIDVLVSLFYANNMAMSIFKTNAGKCIKKDFENNNFTYEQLDNAWSIINPSLSKPLISKENILLIYGEYDQYMSFEDSNKLYKSWNEPCRKLYNCGHSGIVLCKNKIKKDVWEFIKNR